ncbi:MAG: hypothetical protein JJU29_21045 [Verrucomicrobia bacterium]|nr:hypothetical protein [Verrucomicrobiota bacterium]MCH8513852.1 hypothetical protein [Kiritimatiellia bacterium]
MKTNRSSFLRLLFLMSLLAAQPVEAAKSAPLRGLFRKIARQGGRQTASEVAEQAARQGAGTAVRVTAIQSVSPAMRGTAEGLIRTYGDDAARLIGRYGDDAVVVLSRQRGIGVELLTKLGPDAATLARAVPERDMVRLMRHMDDVVALPPTARRSVLDAMSRMPGRVGDFLETHPNLLKTGGFVTVAGGGLVVVNQRVDRTQQDIRETVDHVGNRFFPGPRLDPETGELIYKSYLESFGRWFLLLAVVLATIKHFFKHLNYRWKLKSEKV